MAFKLRKLENLTYDELNDEIIRIIVYNSERMKSLCSDYPECEDGEFETMGFCESTLYDLLYDKDSIVQELHHTITKKYNKNVKDWMNDIILLMFPQIPFK